MTFEHGCFEANVSLYIYFLLFKMILFSKMHFPLSQIPTFIMDAFDMSFTGYH